MSFDAPTRNRLAKFVGDVRTLLTDEFFEQCRSVFGIAQTGQMAPLEHLGDLDDVERATATLLRERVEYLVRTHADEKTSTPNAVTQLVREQAFTVLNRLAAFRMAETRGLIAESVGRGFQSKGFKVFETIAGTGLGDTYRRYRQYLQCLCDELALDLGPLFDRRSPHGMLFPRESALMECLKLINAPDLESLWAEDETIGWVYQYYNDPAERKKMREAPAPRNSRELAVRNQFFTPRYVVEFLTDNTLGRIWYEMTKGRTRIKDQCRYLVPRSAEIFLHTDEDPADLQQSHNLTQEELVQQLVHIPHRSLKDPREIRMLDPACGSMHFGLYAFDLFEVMYDEAWEIARGTDRFLEASVSFLNFVSLAASFSDKGAFLTEVPRFIIEHNLHGIDIDPRAAQIAGLSLWLRAQRTWQQQSLHPKDRPRISRSNIVCAEPMPGDEVLLNEFIEKHLAAAPERKLLGQLVRRVFDSMKLAGEAGSLLKIEDEIAGAVAEAKHKWLSAPKPEQGRLFANDRIQPVQLGLDISGITDQSFWERAEERIYAALEAYAEEAEHGGGYQRRLFADDAARGFAFIDVCRQRYDVVLMNPPFGEPAAASKQYLAESFATTKYDLFAMFVVRWLERLEDTGILGAITNKTGFFLQTFETWRQLISTETHTLGTVIDLGFGVLDTAMVETMAYTIQKTSPSPEDRTVFIRLAKELSKQPRLQDAIDKLRTGVSLEAVWLKNVSEFNSIPHRPMCYWAGDEFVDLFKSGDSFGPKHGHIYQGIATGDNFRFLRTRWEVPPDALHSRVWVTYAKGGASTLWVSDFPLVVLWPNDGSEIKANAQQCYGSASRTVKNEDVFFKPGLTYTQVTVKGFFARALPEDAVFDMKGPLVLVKTGGLYRALGIFCSLPIRALAKLITDARQWHPTNLMRLPYPQLNADAARRLEEAVRRLVASRQAPLRVDEISSLFCFPSANGDFENEVALADQVDDVVASAFGASVTDFRDLDSLLQPSETQGEELDEAEDDANPDPHPISYAVGVAFGRWDLRLATSEKPTPELPDPFAPLPICPPGQLQNERGLPITREEVEQLKERGKWNYPIEIPWDGILVDDPGHPRDVEASVHRVLQIIWKEGWEAIERKACERWNVRSVREYFRRPSGFFADHLKQYSKSRRQAPIYWPLSTANGAYTLWIYYQRLSDQTLHSALADFVDPKIRATEGALADARAANRRQETDDLADLLSELQGLRTELERVIRLPWKPNLNDGVLVTASPLWKLFRLPKWQRDAKSCWEQLASGEYDWPHLAFGIWPDRVKKACENDRSLAIAHNLEHLCNAPAVSKKSSRSNRKGGLPAASAL